MQSEMDGRCFLRRRSDPFVESRTCRSGSRLSPTDPVSPFRPCPAPVAHGQAARVASVIARVSTERQVSDAFDGGRGPRDDSHAELAKRTFVARAGLHPDGCGGLTCEVRGDDAEFGSRRTRITELLAPSCVREFIAGIDSAVIV